MGLSAFNNLVIDEVNYEIARRISYVASTGGEVLDAQHATNEQFAALADVVSDVTNVEQWYLEERRDFINGLQAWCSERDYPFPFTLVEEEGTPTVPLQAEEEHTHAE